MFYSADLFARTAPLNPYIPLYFNMLNYFFQNIWKISFIFNGYILYLPEDKWIDMISQETLSAIVDSQKESFFTESKTIDREAMASVPCLESFATVITGIRRCGKSTLLQQYMSKNAPDAFFLNFEDIRLAGFEVSDFSRLYSEIVRRGNKMLCFDELQLVRNWEMFVHQLLREGFRVFITGSNATLLSREMGTHLTGRHLSIELFPFPSMNLWPLRVWRKMPLPCQLTWQSVVCLNMLKAVKPWY